MINNISVTFGSKDLLNTIKQQHPERPLKLFVSDNNEDSFELIDPSGEKSIFKNPINYNVITHDGNDNWAGYISYINLELDDNQQKILDATINDIIDSHSLPSGVDSIYSLNVSKKTSNRVILTTWNDSKQLLKWYHSKSANQFFQFNDKLDSNYFEIIYQAVKN
ncbi:hypothetical protein [Nicoliella lavandulae]|uniref:ABM domain-containing protein n=1 Tax=Nicoliella lavandulae TaxID=3082954 RepID=A0ABU8SMY6_9LACO